MSHAVNLTAPGQLRRDARIIGLLFASTTSMIGSGWLFGAFHAAKIAGPLSIWSWIVGAVIIMLIALCFAELAALFPKSGALVHMSHASHGEGLGRIWAWMLFLAYVAVPSVEAEAVVTYANNYLPTSSSRTPPASSRRPGLSPAPRCSSYSHGSTFSRCARC